MTPKTRVDDLLESRGLSDFEKMKLMVWGDDHMGLEGLRGRIEKNSKSIKWLIVANGLTLVLVLAHLGLDFDGHGGLLGIIVKFLLGL
jgi:hypothetical protein